MAADWAASTLPVVGAPMAGPGTPELAAAISNAGGFGMLPAGYQPVDKLAAAIDRTRSLTERGFGVNVFVPSPQDEARDAGAVQRYADQLAPIAQSLDAPIPAPRWDDTDSFDAKIDLLEEQRIPLVSFVFGLPPVEAVQRLHAVGTQVMATVTDADEALAAVRGHADLLCVQGAQAGGHRGTHSVQAIPNDRSWQQLLGEVRSVTAAPLVVAGGITTASEVRLALELGAVAVQCGTAFLLTDEAGTSAAYRAGLTDDTLDELVVTRAFSGRPARGLRNDFVDRFDAAAPSVFPIVDQLTKPMRAAATRGQDHQLINLWAGTGWRQARSGPAADIVAELAAGLAPADG
ncbi:NAD(P)H-dependent flavin oxidoreductase [Flexivirga meconopsidis]|uniref:NAD(P)H-dependent flavin oxidoreductase n=1 Tax=Flexivirga meconopsidis TaxID=2977121 RepID=UPI002240508B|nr:nitronate monooxygenase [Flexivirga meconopsidis]